MFLLCLSWFAKLEKNWNFYWIGNEWINYKENWTQLKGNNFFRKIQGTWPKCFYKKIRFFYTNIKNNFFKIILF
jgi:hypothetical protein